ncbi:MAG: ComEC/Rec2 family competence protein, partial [Candidatus Omnitrophica bacterium]|nr:ComEC/Rec2 family competence protein [Candidatus Omnitrophota bacterium]
LTIPPIFFLSIAFGAGIWLASCFWFPFHLMMFIAGLSLVGLALSVRKRFFAFLSILVFLVFGILFGINDRMVSERHISNVGFDGPLSLEGMVATAPETLIKGKKKTVSFVLKAHHFFRDGSYYETEGKVQVFLHNPQTSIHFGDWIRLRGRLESPRKSRNFHSFDYGEYLARNGITKIFRGIGRFSVTRQVKGRGSRIFSSINDFRMFLKERLASLFPAPHHELASALILGFRKNIPQEIQDAFIKTGTAHLLAISGLNISLVAGLFYFSLSFFQIPRACNLFLAIAFVVFYTVLAGANIPVLRAGIMGVVMLLGFLLGEERNLKSAFFFAFFVLLAMNPSALFSASFQLSFIAMASLIFLLPDLEKAVKSTTSEEGIESFLISNHPFMPRKIWALLLRSTGQTFLASLAATIGMFPILIWYFNLFSLIGFLANVIAIPVCTIGIASTLILLLVDLVFSPLAHWLAFFPLAFFKFELWLIEYLAKVPVGYFYLPSPPWSFFLFYYGFLTAWLFLSARPRFARARFGCLFGIAMVVGVYLAGINFSTPRFVFFDLGKNDSAFFSFSNGANCLINTGRHFPNNQAYWILRPFLMASGIQKLDSLLLTQVNGWHAGGLAALREHVQFQKIWIPPGSGKIAAWNRYIEKGMKRLKIDFLSEGDRIQFGSGSKSYVNVLAVSGKQILAFSVYEGTAKMLYIVSAKAETFKILSQISNPDYEFIFLPHHEFEMSEDEKMFLKRFPARFIILNQRGNVDHFRDELKTFVNAAILPIEQVGAVEFYQSQGKWVCKTFLNPSPSSGCDIKTASSP